ncbi:MAG TPA: hypothetical protein VES89_05555, partial [Candidatus Competibacteraceae bacterium]|nr:hypothetical protein [Candidatus Competibacteraceae bacterium]
MWKPQGHWVLAATLLVLIPSLRAWVHSQELAPNSPPHMGRKSTPTPNQGMTPSDAVAQAQQPQPVPADRPEQHLTTHDQSAVFQATQAQPVSPALANQPDDGKIMGF